MTIKKVKCDNCGNEISEMALVCPHCEYCALTDEAPDFLSRRPP